jgi:hypothetical protein
MSVGALPACQKLKHTKNNTPLIILSPITTNYLSL